MSMELRECLFQRGFLLVRGIRFTLPFRETITIGSGLVPRMPRSTPLLRRGALLIRGLWLRDENVGPGSAAQRQARCTASGTRCSCSPNGAVQAVVLKLDFRKSVAPGAGGTGWER